MADIVTVSVSPALSPAEADAVGSLVAEATAHDGVGPLSEEARLAVRHGGGPARHVIARLRVSGGSPGPGLAGYGYLDLSAPEEGAVGELVVAPAARRQGVGRDLLAAMIEETGAAGARFWAHGGLPAALRLADAFGLRLVRELLTMRLPLQGPELPTADFPSGVTVRTFEAGRDESAWLAVNGRAFAHHPEQGAWTERDLRLRMAEPWFDPRGFFLAEKDGRLVGFHWTKAEGDEGEVYVVGVDPSGQGLGLGRALTVVGLRHLRERGLVEVMLYVDGDNTAALRTYQGLGFTVSGRDLMFAAGT